MKKESKQSKKVLKGLAGAAIALGGASAFADTDVVYAAEMNEADKAAEDGLEKEGESKASESQELLLASTSVVESTSTANSTSSSDSFSNVESTSGVNSESSADSLSTESSTSGENSESSDQSLSAETSTSAANSESGAGSQSTESSSINSDSVSASTSQSGVESESAVNSETANSQSAADASLSALASAELSLSEAASTSLRDSQNAASSESLSQAQSSYESASEKFKENTSFSEEQIKKLEELRANVEEKQKVVDQIKEKAIREKKQLDSTYWSAADQLANALTQYFFYQTQGVENITQSNWVKSNDSGYQENIDNHVLVQYNNGDRAYFDYENADEDGNILKDKEATNPDKVGQIVIEAKTALYETNQLGWRSNELKITIDKDGNTKYYYIAKETDYQWKEINRKDENGNLIADSTNHLVTKSPNSQNRYIVWINGKSALYTFTGFTDNPMVAGDNRKGLSIFTESEYDKGLDKFNKERSEYTSVSESQSVLKSKIASESVRHSESGSIASGSASDSLKNSENDSQRKSESVANSLASASTSASIAASLSASASTSLEDRKSEVAKRSEDIRTSESISYSIVESLSRANSESQKNSLTKAGSLSTSNEVSQSTSYSLAQSLSVSNSLSQSTSYSLAQSLIASTSASISTSASESESLFRLLPGGIGGDDMPGPAALTAPVAGAGTPAVLGALRDGDAEAAGTREAATVLGATRETPEVLGARRGQTGEENDMALRMAVMGGAAIGAAALMKKKSGKLAVETDTDIIPLAVNPEVNTKKD